MSIDSLLNRYRELDSKSPYFSTGLITLLLLFFLITDLRSAPPADSGFVREDTLGVALGVLMVLPFVFLRKAPLITLITIFLAFSIHSTFDYSLLFISQFTTLMAMFYIAASTDDRRSIFALLISVVTVSFVFGVIRVNVDNAVTFSIIFGSVWIGANIVRARRNRLDVAELTVAELDEERARTAREAVRDERARIARELHDVLGHTLNLVVIQAGVAQRVFKSSPEKALEVVGSIESTSRQALSDVDRMLGIMRDPDDEVNAAPSLEARPSLGRINGLISDLNSAAHVIDLVISGNVATLPASTDLTAYRVVQEALTNVMTHASGSNAKVEIDYGNSDLEVTVTNDGTGEDTLADRKSGGRGIVGMKERTSMFGGKFEAGSTENGGWRVNATFPISRNNVADESGDSK